MPPDRLPAGSVFHTMGYPLGRRSSAADLFTGCPKTPVGRLVVGLDYRDPLFDPHMAFNRFKQHPFMRSLLEGGQMIRYGAKALPEGGRNSIPRPYMDGGLLGGDAGGFLNAMRLKGFHLAMRTGMLAAESAFEAIRAGDTSAAGLIDVSPVCEKLYPVRNVHQAFSYGLLAGLNTMECEPRRDYERAARRSRRRARPGTSVTVKSQD